MVEETKPSFITAPAKNKLCSHQKDTSQPQIQTQRNITTEFPLTQKHYKILWNF